MRAIEDYMLHPAHVLALSVERVNETFRNSGIGNVSLRLVHTGEVDYQERGSEEFTDLYRLVDGEGPFKDVRRLRNEKHAAVVGMVVDDPRGCGLSTRVAPDADDAYFVVHYACAAITISIAHEIGHILGVRHDRKIDPSNRPFPYGHGYVNGTKWRDIMSYAESCDGCVRIPYWSNPRVFYKGEPTGTLTEDNARVILKLVQLQVSKGHRPELGHRDPLCCMRNPSLVGHCSHKICTRQTAPWLRPRAHCTILNIVCGGRRPRALLIARGLTR